MYIMFNFENFILLSILSVSLCATHEKRMTSTDVILSVDAVLIPTTRISTSFQREVAMGL